MLDIDWDELDRLHAAANEAGVPPWGVPWGVPYNAERTEFLVALRNAYPALRDRVRYCTRFSAEMEKQRDDAVRERDDLRAEVERLRRVADAARRPETHPWETLLEILDSVYPESIFPTTQQTGEPDRDQGPRIVALIRWVRGLQQERDGAVRQRDELLELAERIALALEYELRARYADDSGSGAIDIRHEARWERDMADVRALRALRKSIDEQA